MACWSSIKRGNLLSAVSSIFVLSKNQTVMTEIVTHVPRKKAGRHKNVIDKRQQTDAFSAYICMRHKQEIVRVAA